MKKILLMALCSIVLLSAQARESKVEEFMKKNSTQKGGHYIEISETMLKAAFEPKKEKEKYPRKYKSLVLSETSKADELKKILTSEKYEVLMAMNSERAERKIDYSKSEDKAIPKLIEIVTTYYFLDSDKANEKELVIVQQESSCLIISYMQGDLDVSDIRYYLLVIRGRLNLMNATQLSLNQQDFNTTGFSDFTLSIVSDKLQTISSFNNFEVATDSFSK